jgi:O-antigen ligase
MLYAGARMASRGRARPLLGLVAGLSLVAALLLFTPLRGVIEARFAHQHSNTGRETLYIEAAQSVLHAPLLGFGSPHPSEINPNLPSVGTQGQFWLVLYSHGLPGLVFYVGWYLVCFWQTLRGRSWLSFWCNVSIFIAIIQLPFYGQLPAQIQITMIAAALSMRETRLRAQGIPVTGARLHRSWAGARA